jgi:hypothetical protein
MNSQNDGCPICHSEVWYPQFGRRTWGAELGGAEVVAT